MKDPLSGSGVMKIYQFSCEMYLNIMGGKERHTQVATNRMRRADRLGLVHCSTVVTYLEGLGALY